MGTKIRNLTRFVAFAGALAIVISVPVVGRAQPGVTMEKKMVMRPRSLEDRVAALEDEVTDLQQHAAIRHTDLPDIEGTPSGSKADSATQEGVRNLQQQIDQLSHIVEQIRSRVNSLSHE